MERIAAQSLQKTAQKFTTAGKVSRHRGGKKFPLFTNGGVTKENTREEKNAVEKKGPCKAPADMRGSAWLYPGKKKAPRRGKEIRGKTGKKKLSIKPSLRCTKKNELGKEQQKSFSRLRRGVENEELAGN